VRYQALILWRWANKGNLTPPIQTLIIPLFIKPKCFFSISMSRASLGGRNLLMVTTMMMLMTHVWAHSSSRSDRSENRRFRIKHSSSAAEVSRGHGPVVTPARMNYDCACAPMIVAANLYCSLLHTVMRMTARVLCMKVTFHLRAL